MIDYLNTPHYYSEHPIDVEESEEQPRTIGEPTDQQNGAAQTNEVSTNGNFDAPNVTVSTYVFIQNPARNGNVSGERQS